MTVALIIRFQTLTGPARGWSEGTYSDNEELLAKLAAGGKGYDMYVPTSHAVQALIRSARIKPIDNAKLPNLKNTTLPFSTRHSIPASSRSLRVRHDEHRLRRREGEGAGATRDTWH
jgi:hypothetical protein